MKKGLARIGTSNMTNLYKDSDEYDLKKKLHNGMMQMAKKIDSHS